MLEAPAPAEARNTKAFAGIMSPSLGATQPPPEGYTALSGCQGESLCAQSDQHTTVPRNGVRPSSDSAIRPLRVVKIWNALLGSDRLCSGWAYHFNC